MRSTIDTIRVSTEQRRWRLAHRHRLAADRRIDDVLTIADDLVALHSSDPATVHLSALARMHDPDLARIERSLYDDRSLIRHHAMRRTLWVMSPHVARLAHGAATTKIARAERKRTITALADAPEIADAETWLASATTEVIGLLTNKGPLTTRSIGRALPHLVVPLRFGATTKHPGSLNAHTKVLQGAGFAASLLRTRPTGSWTSSEYFWSPTQAWIGQSLHGIDEAAAASELLNLWLHRFGPATENDIGWWFGWSAGLTRRSLTLVDALEVEIDGERGFVARGDVDKLEDPGPWVRLLPGLDPTAMGWKDRDWYIDPNLVPRLFDRFGNAGPTIWVDGEIVGGWAQRPDGDVAVELAAPLAPEHQVLLDQAIDQFAVSTNVCPGREARASLANPCEPAAQQGHCSHGTSRLLAQPVVPER